ncbi:putative F-box-like domain superfamily protein [Helianthus annuus]|uniref:F-box-like domain superfamily protein n=1 Tax=Helianthus annuus TaxID=4232 RepID=A0A251UWB9_HELAN|nr:putative F-box-like domain superfamily protein [Helianthus annuus]KAJ0929703.1 putative F-box-like domain superfamily protein [Helianthus annuus]
MSLPATIINDLCMNLLENILARLPAVDFASADCINHLWHLVCARILSRPKLSSACSFSDYPQITAKLGSRVPVITIFSDTNMGRDAISDESRETQRNPEGMITVMRKVDHVMSPETVIVGAHHTCGFKHTDGYSGHKTSTEKNVTAYALVFARENNKALGIGETKFQAVLSSGLLPVGPVYAASVKKRYGFYTGLTARIEGSRENLDGDTLLSQAYEEIGGMYRTYRWCIGVTKRRKFSNGREKVEWITSVSFHEVKKINQGCLFVNDTDMDIKTGDTFRFYFPDPITDLFSNANVSNHLSSFKQRNTTHSDKWEVFGGLIFTSFGRGVSFDKLLFLDNFPGGTLGCIFFGRVFGRGDLTPCVDNSPYLDNFPRETCGGAFCGLVFRRSEKTPHITESQERKLVRHCVHEYGALYLIMSYIPKRN